MNLKATDFMNNYTKKKSTINIHEKQQKSLQTKKSYRVYVLAIICFLFAFILYSNTLKHSYVLDDNGVISSNWLVKKGVQSIPVILKTTYRYGVNDLSDNIYRPLSLIMFSIEWQIAPNNPYLSHFINVLFYALSCLLLFIVLRKYMSKAHTLIPFVITLLYAAHPIHTEVVSNIKSRDEIMSFFFLMLTLLLLHKWFAKRKWWGLIVSLPIFFLAFLSKEGVITMLFIFPLMAWYFTEAKSKTILIGSLLPIIPALVYIIIRHQITSKYSVSSSISILDNFLVGATDSTTHFATAVLLLGKYLLLTIIPYQLVCDYSYNQIPIIGLTNHLFIISVAVYLAISIYVIKNFRKKSPLIFGLLFFLITISMYSNIVYHIGTSFGERLMFLPSLGLCITFVFFISKLFSVGTNNNTLSISEIFKTKPLFTTICILVILAFSVKTVVRASDWKNKDTLYSNDIKHSPNSANLCMWQGNALFERAIKEKDKLKKDAFTTQAIQQYEKCVLIYPNYIESYEQLSIACSKTGDMKKALLYAKNVLKLDPTKFKMWDNIGFYYYELGDYKKAIEVYNKVVSINPTNLVAYYNRGLAKEYLHDYQGAIDDYTKLIVINPKYDSAYFNRGLLRNKFQDYKGAINDFTKAIEINPNYTDAYNDRGTIKVDLKDYQGAIADFTKVTDINPNYANAYYNKACILGALHKYKEAIIEYEKYTKFNPDNIIDAYKNIGLIYQNLKQPEEAQQWFEKARILEQKGKNK